MAAGDLLKTTSVGSKGPGDKLTYSDINSMNTTINSCVGVINSGLKDKININMEITGNMETKLSLGEAISAIPVPRRTLGMEVKFFSSDTGKWETYEYVGTKDSLFTDLSLWYPISKISIIDGGEF